MKRALATCALAAILNGCGGASSSLPRTPAALPPNVPDSPHTKNLLYVIVSGFSDVYYYSYLPAPLKFIGKLTGLKSPSGLCVDKAGNVFVTGQGYVAKYAHGGTKPVAMLKLPNSTADSCAVDPATGDLAVAAYPKTDYGFVLIYRNARGTPMKYSDARLQYPSYLGYDDKSDLFMDGDYYYYRSSSCCFVPAFGELPAHDKTFVKLNLNVGIGAPSTVQWEDKYLDIEDASGGVIYEFSFRGRQGTKAGSTALKGIPSSIYPVQAVWIQGKNVVGSDSSYAEVGIWHYPKGGKPFRALTGLYSPTAVVVSLKS